MYVLKAQLKYYRYTTKPP